MILRVDQEFLGGARVVSTYARYCTQEFTPTATLMDVVQLDLWASGPATAQVQIRQGAVTGPRIGVSGSVNLIPYPGDPFYPNIAPLPQTLATFIFDPLIPLTPGERYVIEILPSPVSSVLIMSYSAPNGGDGYPRGRMLFGGEAVNVSDLWFREGLRDPCEMFETEVANLQTQITDMRDALASGEIPPPPQTPQRVAAVRTFIDALVRQLPTAERRLSTCRSAHPWF
jgi:hypothetical protein